MSSPAFKEFIKTPKGKLVLALGAMLLSWIFLFLNFAGSSSIALPSEARKAELKQQIRKLRTELQGLNEKQAQADRVKKRWQELAMSSWQPSQNGDPELLLRQIVENAAKKSELKLNNLGTVRINRINQDFSFAELDVSGSTRLAPLTNFAYEIQKIRPAITWRRFSVFVMMRRPRTGNNRTVSSNQNDDNLAFSGNLRLLVYNPENGDAKAAELRAAMAKMKKTNQGTGSQSVTPPKKQPQPNGPQQKGAAKP